MTRVLVWGSALIIILGAAVLAGGASQVSKPIAAPVVAQDGALARCRALGEAAGQDARCRAAWTSARARFFGGTAS